MYQKSTEHDELRARFTTWLEQVLQHERAHYLKAIINAAPTVSFDDIAEEDLVSTQERGSVESTSMDFDFEEERLAEAFAHLSPKRQQVLTMIFAEEKKSGKIARELNMAPANVYLLRSRAIHDLKEYLREGGREK